LSSRVDGSIIFTLRGDPEIHKKGGLFWNALPDPLVEPPGGPKKTNIEKVSKTLSQRGKIQTKSRVFERLGHLWHPRGARDTIFQSLFTFLERSPEHFHTLLENRLKKCDSSPLSSKVLRPYIFRQSTGRRVLRSACARDCGERHASRKLDATYF